MSDALDAIASGAGHDSVAELRRRLVSLCDMHTDLMPDFECFKLASSVHRVALGIDGHSKTYVIKRLESAIGVRDALAARKWLPAVGLDGRGPPLLDSCAADDYHVWHIYDDLGDTALDERTATANELEAAIRLIAGLHSRFAAHPLLAECRLSGLDLGIQFFATSVCDAIRALEALNGATLAKHEGGLNVRDGLLERLHTVQRQQSDRIRQLAESGGVETLLHGDLWPMNVLVTSRRSELFAQLIDWDHAGVGQPAYDLSNFLGRVRKEHRRWLLEVYGTEIESVWRLPDTTVLSEIFDTCQQARLANRVIWPALEMLRTDTQWALDELRRVDSWFDLIESDFFGPANPVGARDLSACRAR